MNVHRKLGRLKKICHRKLAVGCRKLHTCVHRLRGYKLSVSVHTHVCGLQHPAADLRQRIFSLTISIFCKRTSIFTCHPIFSLPEWKNCRRKSGFGYCKSESDTCNYKDRKCAVNENPSVRIESAGSKTCNNSPLKNRSAVSNFSIVCW